MAKKEKKQHEEKPVEAAEPEIQEEPKAPEAVEEKGKELSTTDPG